MEDIHYGQLLKAIVKERGFTQRELAGLLGVSQPTVSDYFNAKDPSIGTVRKICAACSLVPWRFIAETETGIDMKVWENFEMILMLEPNDRTFVFKTINNALDLIIERRKI